METIKEHIVITQDSYDLDKWTNSIIQKCIEDNPSMPVAHIAKLLGVCDRTIARRAAKGHIHLKKVDRERFSIALDKDMEQITKFK